MREADGPAAAAMFLLLPIVTKHSIRPQVHIFDMARLRQHADEDVDMGSDDISGSGFDLIVHDTTHTSHSIPSHRIASHRIIYAFCFQLAASTSDLALRLR